MLTRQLVRRIGRRVVNALREPPAEVTLLEMVWPEASLDRPPEVKVAAGYALRQYEPGDLAQYVALLHAAELDMPRLDYWERHILPDGFFVIQEDASKRLVAACFASLHPVPRHPRAGNLGWLAAHPGHQGKGLGYAVSAAVTARLLRAGYRRLYLETHDFRLPAIKLYLRLGWIPLLYSEEMIDRWKLICDRINWRYTPDSWPR